MRKKLLSLALALCMALALLSTAAFAADSDFTIVDGVLTKYNGNGGNVVIPSGVTSIDSWAFENCSGLTSVTIPDGVTSIGYQAFQKCENLTSVSIPSSVTSIDQYAFSGTPWLVSQGEFAIVNGILLVYQGGGGNVTIPDGVTSIGNGAFWACINLTSVTIPAGVTTIDSGAFYNCYGLTSVSIPAGVTSIGDSAFSGCKSLTSVTIPSSVTTIERAAFSGCTSLTSVTIPNSVTSIGDSAFFRCSSLTSVTIPSSMTTIDGQLFSYCTSLTNVTISAGVTSIGTYSFEYCSNLTSVTIPSSVTYIETGAFSDCESLTDLYYGGSEAQWNTIQTHRDYGGKVESEIAIEKYDYTEDIPNATVHYNSAMPDTPSASAVGGFTDVHENDYFAAPILWAVGKSITNGTTDTTFSPSATCTRGQVVTFLYRALDMPSSSVSNPFTDVDTSEYYGDAVLWAYKNNITSGTTGTTFSPNNTCTRGQVVTFLWRAMGSPTPSSTSSNFTDVTDPNDFYYQAVLWAVENGITSGTSATTFSPNATCTRGQVVTFLYNTFAD